MLQRFCRHRGNVFECNRCYTQDLYSFISYFSVNCNNITLERALFNWNTGVCF